MKRTLFSLLAALCLTLLLLPTTAEAADPVPEGLKYEIDGDEVTITDYAGSATTLTIPATIEGKPVTTIGRYAFSRCTSLTAITIPNSVTAIDDGAFQDCTSLTTITIPDSVTSIGDETFKGCTALSYNRCGNANYLGNDNNPYLVLVSPVADYISSCIIPDETKLIVGGAFSGCAALTNITIPDGIIDIGSYTFSSCTSLTKVSIPDSVKYIGSWAFSGCKDLKEVIMGDGVTSIGYSAFGQCISLTDISLGNSVEWIYGDAFYGCTALKKISIPDSITYIYPDAFDGCSALTYNRYDNAKYLGNDKNPYVVLDRSIATDILSCQIHPDTKIIADRAFIGCTALKEIDIPDKVVTIGTRAFERCAALATVTIGDSVEHIYGGAFYGCETLAEITLPESVAEIGGGVRWAGEGYMPVTGTFGYCTALKKITFLGDLPHFYFDHFRATTATAYYPCGNDTWTDEAVQELAEDEPTITWTVDHIQKTVPGKDATCTATGLTEGKACNCGEVVTVKQQTITKLAHSYKNGVCTKCSAKDPNYVPPVEGVDRVYGSSRYDTAFQSADTLKKQMGVEKFSCAIVTSGDNFADALAGSYLAYVKNAPILLTDNDNIGDVMAYIQKNVASGATVYALGGKAVVTDKLLDLEKKGYDVKRLAGKSRFETNLEILKECGSVAGKDILVCTGFNFADSLSASAAKRPILLVDDKLTDGQKAYLKQQSGCKYCIVGGTGAVTSSVEKSLKSYGSVSRLAGSNRFETSVMVAKKFFSDPTTAVLAYGYNFPDGLCAGPLAATINAPLILTATGDEAQAAAYAKEEGIKDGYVLGGSALINDKAVKKIFSMGSGDKIQ